MRTFLAILALLWSANLSSADALDQHFFGTNPVCSQRGEPVVVVADLTITGEIDDNITVRQIDRLQSLGCVRTLALVSIRGNGESSTAEIHANLEMRLPLLGLKHLGSVPLLRGPDRPTAECGSSPVDDARYRRIAYVINKSNRPVTMVELGPMTVSAMLLRCRYVEAGRIRRVLGVGGREWGESFTTGKNLGLLFSFTDFNIRKDKQAADYLVRHYGDKLHLVTYRTGIGDRMVRANDVAKSIPALATHAKARAKTMRRLGYESGMIPSWDTWLTAFFLKGGAERLGCRKTRARVIYEERLHSANLLINRRPRQGHIIIACHEVGN